MMLDLCLCRDIYSFSARLSHFGAPPSVVAFSFELVVVILELEITGERVRYLCDLVNS